MRMPETLNRTMWITFAVRVGMMLDMRGSPFKRRALHRHRAKGKENELDNGMGLETTVCKHPMITDSYTEARKGKTTTTSITIFLIVRERMKTSAHSTPLKKWNSSKSGKTIHLFQKVGYAAVSGSPSGGAVCSTLGRVTSIQKK